MAKSVQERSDKAAQKRLTIADYPLLCLTELYPRIKKIP